MASRINKAMSFAIFFYIRLKLGPGTIHSLVVFKQEVYPLASQMPLCSDSFKRMQNWI